MKTGFAISGIMHAAVLLWALTSFAPKAMNSPPPESMPIDLVSASEFSQLRAGAQKAKAEEHKPLVEKVGESKPVENVSAKVVDKPRPIQAAAEPAGEKPPEPKPAREKPPEPKPEINRSDPEKARAEPKPDAIAEVLKKDHKPEPKKDPKPVQKKHEAKPQPKFDANRIAALLDKRQAQRTAAAGETLNSTMALGTRTGTASRLAQSEIDALRAKLARCWNPPVGAINADRTQVLLLIRLNQDGTLAGPPQPEGGARDATSRAMMESAVRATIQCQPYDMLSAAHYETWKELEIDFNSIAMFGG
jgi:outer membrane biosynthesis protein TonB